MSVAPRATGSVSVTVHECKELADRDSGKQDPFVKLKLGEQSFKTKTHKKGGTAPKFKETFLFNVKDYDLKEKFGVEVWDEDALSNDKIGRTDIHLDSLVSEGQHEDGHWFQLTDWSDKREICGYIRLSVKAEGKGFPGSKSEHPVAKAALEVEKELPPLHTTKHEDDDGKHKEEERRREEAKKKHEEPKKHEEDSKKATGHETRLHAKHSGLYLDVSEVSHKDGAPLHQWSKTDGLNQVFIFIDQKDGSYAIVAKHSGKALNVAAHTDGTKITQETRNLGDSQKWFVKNNGDGTYRISSFTNRKKSIDVAEVSKKEGAAIHLWENHDMENQKWILENPLLITGHESILTAKHSGLVMDVSEVSHKDGAHLHQWTKTEGLNQVFIFNEQKDGSYEILAKHSGKALSVTGNDNGAQITQHERNHHDWQRWIVKSHGDGTYRISSVVSKKSMDVAESSHKPGAHIHQWENHELDNQKWTFSHPLP